MPLTPPSTTPPTTEAGDVFPIMSGWSFSKSAGLVSGTKVFVDGASAPSGATTETLPAIGSSWDTTYAAVTCKTIKATYVDNNPTCPMRYECYYDSMSMDQYLSGGDTRRLPISMQISGNFRTYANQVGSAGAWRWNAIDGSGLDCGAEFNAPICELSKSLSVVRYIYAGDLDRWSEATDKIVGCVNLDDFWPTTGTAPAAGYAFPKETLLYLGADIVEMTNNTNATRWECTLKFEASFKSNDAGTTMLGWNYEFNPKTGKFEKPEHAVGATWKNLYEKKSFWPLFSTGTASYIPNSAFPLS